MNARRSRILGWLLSGLCWMALSPTPAWSQSRTAVGVGESFTVAATPPADPTVTALRFFVDTTQVGADVPIAGSSEVVTVVGGIAQPGRHRLEAAAVNTFGAGPRSGLDFCVGPPSGCVPPAPSLPRIQVSTTTVELFDQVPLETGGITLRLVGSDTKTAVTEVK